METKTVNHSKMKLGKLAAVKDNRTLCLAKYLAKGLPAAPASHGYAEDIPKEGWGMLANDTIGDCTCAAAGHLEMEWTDDNKLLFTPTDEQIIEAYSAITGYDPATGANDNGAQELDVLKYWYKNGIAGHKIGAYAEVNVRAETELKQAFYLFGGAYIGLALPLTAQTQDIWKLVTLNGEGEPGSWGGHAVPVIGYSAKYIYIVTWGAVKRMTWSFWQAYCDEAYAILSPDFVSATEAPNGFDLAQLQADLKEVTA